MPCSYIPVECDSELALNKVSESLVSHKEKCISFCEQVLACWLIKYDNASSVCKLFTSTIPAQVFSDVCIAVENSEYFKRQCFEGTYVSARFYRKYCHLLVIYVQIVPSTYSTF